MQLGFEGHIEAGTRQRWPADSAQRTLSGPVWLGTSTSGHQVTMHGYAPAV
ncbi:MAG: hypothetical protein ABR926_23850 [Streptosporangiaceae bacterium]